MTRSTRSRTWAAAALALFAAACDTGITPEVAPELDAEAAVEDFDAMRAAIASDDLAGFRALGGRTPFGSSPAAVDAVAAMISADTGVGGRAFALDLARRMAAAVPTGAGPSAGPIISGWHRGTTFVYDPESDEYRPDLTLEGAPETGVRFVLYDVDETGTPILGSETGYADLVDEGDGSAEDLVLRLLVVQSETTVLDYRTTLDHDATSAALTVGGFLRGDGVQLDFDVAVAAEDTEDVARIDLDFEIGVAARDFSIVGQVRGVEEDEEGQGEVHLEVRHRQDRLGVDLTGADGQLDGTVTVDGAPFALIRGPAHAPEITDPSGEPLTWAERIVLHRVVDVVEDVFDLLEDLVDPVDELVLLGFIL